jgi:ribose transport system ATP-binding protein
LGFVPEDRRECGLILGMSTSDNIVLPKLGQLKSCILNNVHINDLVQNCIQKFNIVLGNRTQLVQELSGGNQQKVVIAKWLAMNPDILILDEPTRGIDVGAKAEIYSLVDRLREQGLSIILISSEVEEIMKMSDNIIILHEGNFMAEFSNRDATQEKIMYAAIGEKK